MNRYLLTILYLSFLSCANKGSNNEQTQNSILENETVTEEFSTNKKSDEFLSQDTNKNKIRFMNFLQDFMWDKEYQQNNVAFPIDIKNLTIKTKEEWTHLSFYQNTDIIPILSYDTITFHEKGIYDPKITVNILDFNSKISEQFDFEKNNSIWKLIQISENDIRNVPDYDFILFLEEFSNDSLFQFNSIEFPLRYCYLDIENDYKITSSLINNSEWKHTNIFGHLNGLMVLDLTERTTYRNVCICGNRNGINERYIFSMQNDGWKLIKIEAFSA